MKTLILSTLLFSFSACAADLTGTWKFSVDLEDGQHGDPVFVLKQVSNKLSGTYSGPFGDQPVNGEVNGDNVVLTVAAANELGSVKLSYKGKLTGDAKINGNMTRDISGSVTPGKWSAARK